MFFASYSCFLFLNFCHLNFCQLDCTITLSSAILASLVYSILTLKHTRKPNMVVFHFHLHWTQTIDATGALPLCCTKSTVLLATRHSFQKESGRESGTTLHFTFDTYYFSSSCRQEQKTNQCAIPLRRKALSTWKSHFLYCTVGLFSRPV